MARPALKGCLDLADMKKYVDDSAGPDEGERVAPSRASPLEVDQFGIITFGSEAVVSQPMTADRAVLTKSLDKIKPDPLAHTAMWDGVVSGMAILNGLPDYEHHLLLVTDGKDDSSKASAAQARGDVIGSGGNSGADSNS